MNENLNNNGAKKFSLKPNLLLFWLRAKYEVNAKMLVGQYPNVILGIIPFGKQQISQPLKTVSSVMTNTKLYFKKFLIGLVLLILMFSTLNTDFSTVTIILGIWGALILLNSYQSTFIIVNNGGQRTGYRFSFLDYGTVKRLAAEVNNHIAEL